MYSKVVTAGMKMLYDKKAHKKIVEALKAGAQDPARALASVTKSIMSRISEKAKIPIKVRAQATNEILGMVAELAEKSGAFPIDEAVLRETGKAMSQQSAGAPSPQERVQNPAGPPPSAQSPEAAGENMGQFMNKASASVGGTPLV
jgi:hypothetical protein